MNIAIIVFTLILAVMVVPSVVSNGRPECHDTPITRVPSPDGSLVVHLYHRNCTEVSYTAAMMRTPVVEVRHSGYGYIDNQGRMAIRPQYDAPANLWKALPG